MLQHVDDAQAALHEMARVLRPGGRALVLDADHGSNVESDLPRHVETALQEAFSRGCRTRTPRGTCPGRR